MNKTTCAESDTINKNFKSPGMKRPENIPGQHFASKRDLTLKTNALHKSLYIQLLFINNLLTLRKRKLDFKYRNL